MPPMKPDERLVMAGAMLMLDHFEAGTAAAMAGLPVDTFLTACENPEIQRRIEAEVLKLKVTGKSAELRSALALDPLTAKLAEHVEDPEILPAMLVRIGEFLLRTSGLEQKRGAELRTAEPDQKFFFAVVHPGDPAPTIPEGTKHSFVINLSGKPLELSHDEE